MMECNGSKITQYGIKTPDMNADEGLMINNF